MEQSLEPAAEIVKRLRQEGSKKSGPISKFGDGDGSYWDRWLQVEPPSKSSFNTGVVSPSSGFKKKAAVYKLVPITKVKLSEEKIEKIQKGKISKPIYKSPAIQSNQETHEFVGFHDVADDEVPETVRIKIASPKGVDGRGSFNNELSKSNQVYGMKTRDFSSPQTQNSNHRGGIISKAQSRHFWGDNGRQRLFQTFAAVHEENREFSKLFSLAENVEVKQVTHPVKRKHSLISLPAYNIPNFEKMERPKKLSSDGEVQRGLNMFIKYCQEFKILPLPIIIRKIQDTGPSTSLDLSRKGIGDKHCIPLGLCLSQLPSVHEINLLDNRLTEMSIIPLIEQFVVTDNIYSLDLSENNLGNAADKLIHYLSGSEKLLNLSLVNCKLNDRLGVSICQALLNNTSLVEVDLSQNELGSTFGVALAKVLLNNNTLTDLNLSWNFIRMEGAEAIGKGMVKNKSLTKLDVSWNSFGEVGGNALGLAIKENKTLKHLNLANNSLTPTSVLIISSSLSSNTSLTTFVLDGNMLGASGGKAIMQSISQSSARTISILNCTFDKTYESKAIFDALHCNGRWLLDLSKAYDYSVATELLALANRPCGVTWESVLYTEPGRGAPRKIKMTKSELPDENDEFAIERGKLCDESGSLYEIPKAGILDIYVKQESIPPQKNLVLDNHKIENILRSLDTKSITQEAKAQIISVCSKEMIFSSDQIAGMLSVAKNDSSMKMKLITSIIPRIHDSDNVQEILNNELNDNEKKTLKKQLGKFIMLKDENMTGHFDLDLHSQQDQLILKRIRQLNVLDMRRSKYRSKRDDVSQNGDWSCFRNIFFNNKPFKIDFEWVCPSAGEISFDYVSSIRPPTYARPMDNNLLKQLVEHIKDILAEGKLKHKEIDQRTVREDKDKKSGKYDVKKASDFVPESPKNITVSENEPLFDIIAITEALEKLRETMNANYITCDQASILLRLFPHEYQGPPENLFCRVDAVVSMFSRIIDLENYSIVVQPLFSHVGAINMHSRLGILNTMNVMNPEGFYSLDLSQREDRIICDILVKLAIREPGENWEDENYDDKVGWELPMSWNDEIPNTGKLILNYTSSGPGCKPDNAFRETLKKKVFCFSARYDK